MQQREQTQRDDSQRSQMHPEGGRHFSFNAGGKEVAGTVTYTIDGVAGKSYEDAAAILAAKKARDSVTVTTPSDHGPT